MIYDINSDFFDYLVNTTLTEREEDNKRCLEIMLKEIREKHLKKSMSR
jgi:hypothetical protein